MSYAFSSHGSGGYGCGSGCSVSYSPSNSGYSALEKTVESYSSSSDYSNTSYMATEAGMPIQLYNNNFAMLNPYVSEYQEPKAQLNITQTITPMPDDFLDPRRPKVAFIGTASEIKAIAEEAFFKTTGMNFPDDIIVKVLPAKNFRKGLQGFAINRKEQGQISEVVIKEDTIDRVMVILGHELGHVMSKRLNSKRDEEAKAFAFSMAWIKAIKEHNIAGLSTAVCIDRPARNGIHDFAHGFVINMIQSGKKAIDIFKGLISGELRCQQ
jgi:hypothetical protein